MSSNTVEYFGKMLSLFSGGEACVYSALLHNAIFG
jgi:hypothetical protein